MLSRVKAEAVRAVSHTLLKEVERELLNLSVLSIEVVTRIGIVLLSTSPAVAPFIV